MVRFVNRAEVAARFAGRRIAVVGSGPGVLGNRPGHVDGHDIVVRVNNYKLSDASGVRTDVFYSFFGTSIKKPRDELIRDGVTLCMSKLPNAHAVDSDWHRRHCKMIGVDFRPHYERRKDWWFCDTYVPTVPEFMVGFELLGRHMPTTGFAAILDVIAFEPRSVYLTGFDFFSSGIHNVDEPHRVKNLDDPYRHRPDLECAWLRANLNRHPITVDAALTRCLDMDRAA